MGSSYCYINGNIMPTEAGTVNITTLGLQRGYGVFDFGRTANGKLFHFDENLARLRRSAAELHLQPPLSDAEITKIANDLIARSELQNPGVRLFLTGGDAKDASPFDHPNLIIIAEELSAFPEELYRNGARIITEKYQREFPHIKSINYLNAIRLEPLKKARNAFDILYYTDRGVTECPRNNFFVFFGDTLVTPADNVLLGVTRKIVLDLAKEHFDVEERTLHFEELRHIDEAFVTSTSKGVLPVVEIDDRKVGRGTVGERTHTMMQILAEYMANY